MKKKGTKDEQTIFQITNQTTILQQAWVNDRIKINGQANHFQIRNQTKIIQQSLDRYLWINDKMMQSRSWI